MKELKVFEESCFITPVEQALKMTKHPFLGVFLKTKIMAIDQQVKNLLRKYVKDFEKQVSKEADLTIIVLRGHLLMEYYLSHLVVYFHDREHRVDKLSFFDKLQIIEKDVTFIAGSSPFYKFNDLRNNLSHELNFQISEAEIDRIGFGIGKDYVSLKFSKNIEEPGYLRDLLVWVVDTLVFEIVYQIYKKNESERKQKQATEVVPNSNQPKKVEASVK